MANKVLQILRNDVFYNSREEAKTGLGSKLATLKGGEPAIAIYIEGGANKLLFGISAGNGQYTMFDPNAVPSDVQALIDAIVGEGTPDAAYNTLVEISSALTIINGAATVEGSIAKAKKDAKDYTDSQIDTVNPITSIEQVLKEDSNYTADEADKYEITKHTGPTEEMQLTFTPLSPLALTVPETIGDIEQGTTAESLNGMPLSQVLDNIIFKTIYPTITQPSGSVSFANGFTNNATMEAGLAMPTDANMNYSFNKGTVKVDDGVTPAKSYVGDATGCTYQVTYTPGTANGNAGVEAGGAAFTGQSLTGEKMTVGRYQFRGIIGYQAGPTLTDSKGNSPNPIKTTNSGNVTNPHPASSLTTSYNLTLNVTLPFFVDNQANGTFSKQALRSWGAMTYTGIKMAGQTAGNPTKIKTPRKLASANSYNAVSGKYDVAQLSNYQMTETQENVNGVEVTYYLYTWIGGALDAVNFEIITY